MCVAIDHVSQSVRVSHLHREPVVLEWYNACALQFFSPTFYLPLPDTQSHFNYSCWLYKRATTCGGRFGLQCVNFSGGWSTFSRSWVILSGQFSVHADDRSSVMPLCLHNMPKLLAIATYFQASNKKPEQVGIQWSFALFFKKWLQKSWLFSSLKRVSPRSTERLFEVWFIK